RGLVHVQVGRVEPGVHVLDAVEDDGPAAVAQQFGRGGGGLDDGAVGGEAAAQHGDAGVGQQRFGAPPDHGVVRDLGPLQGGGERFAGDGDRGRVGQVGDLLEHGARAARPEQVVHQVAPGGLQVDQERDAGAGAVEVVEGQLDAEPAGDGEQVDDGVGGAADGGQGDDRVEERGAGHHLAGPAALADHLDHEAAGVVRALQQPAVGGGGAGGAGDGHAERLGHDGHGGGGAHGVAVPAAADHGRLGRQERLAGEVPGPYLLAEPPHVGAAAERDAAEMAGEHGSAGHHDGGQVDGGGGHQQGRDGLVAAAEQHDAVDRVGAQHLLGGHGGEVAPEHG